MRTFPEREESVAVPVTGTTLDPPLHGIYTSLLRVSIAFPVWGRTYFTIYIFHFSSIERGAYEGSSELTFVSQMEIETLVTEKGDFGVKIKFKKKKIIKKKRKTHDLAWFILRYELYRCYLWHPFSNDDVKYFDVSLNILQV